MAFAAIVLMALLHTSYLHFASMAGWAIFALIEECIASAFRRVCVLGDPGDWNSNDIDFDYSLWLWKKHKKPQSH